MKKFIFDDLESKYDNTQFKKIPGKAPEAIFFTRSGKEVERVNIEKFNRYVLSVALLSIRLVIKQLKMYFQG